MVEVNIVSEDEDQVWDVHAGGRVVCTTPCTQWLSGRQNLWLKARDGDRVLVEGLGPEAMDSRRALLVAEGTCDGKYINGLVFTTLGGMGVVTSIPFIAVGCSNRAERGGMCNAGLITAAVSAPLTAVAIWMIVDGLPKGHVLPVVRGRAAKGQPPVTFALAPNGVVGTF
jgi:hypothetical protein